MNRENLLSSYEYHKLLEKLEDNFSEFYKIFCEGVVYSSYNSVITIMKVSRMKSGIK